MSYINKRGKTTAWKKMVTRQQISDLFVYGSISTTLSRAKSTQKYAERLITTAKTDSVANRRFASSVLLDTKVLKKQDLINHLFTKIVPKFKERKGGYTRVVKAGPRRGDSSEIYILQFVVPLVAQKTFSNKKQIDGKILDKKFNEKDNKNMKNTNKSKKTVSKKPTKKVTSQTKVTKKPKVVSSVTKKSTVKKSAPKKKTTKSTKK